MDRHQLTYRASVGTIQRIEVLEQLCLVRCIENTPERLYHKILFASNIPDVHSTRPLFAGIFLSANNS